MRQRLRVGRLGAERPRIKERKRRSREPGAHKEVTSRNSGGEIVERSGHEWTQGRSVRVVISR
jgi:hypothetical protein